MVFVSQLFLYNHCHVVSRKTIHSMREYTSMILISIVLSKHPGRQRSVREYTSMMTVILEIAYDDQEQPVDEELVRKELKKRKKILFQVREAEQLLSFALELEAHRQMNKSKAGQTQEKSNQMRQTNEAQINIAGKETKDLQEVEKENGMKKDKNFQRKEIKGDDSKMKEEEEDMVKKDFLDVEIHLIKDKKNLAVRIENIK